ADGGFIESLDEPVLSYVLATRDLHRAMVPLESAAIQWFLPSVDAVLTRLKAENGWLDHDDMLKALRDALRSPRGPALTTALRRRFRFALIDEFQDTDTIQWEVFRRIFVDDDSQGRLFLIG